MVGLVGRTVLFLLFGAFVCLSLVMAVAVTGGLIEIRFW